MCPKALRPRCHTRNCHTRDRRATIQALLLRAVASRTSRINARSGNVIGNQNNQEVMTMMQGDWMGSWGTGSMGGWGGLWMILVVILVIVGIVAVIRKK